VPDFMSRTRFLEPSTQVVEGRAWSGRSAVTRVEFSRDGGASWSDTALGDPPSPYAWRRWTFNWDATEPGDYELCVRATDAAGNVQPDSPDWNLEGVQNNAIQRVPVVVGKPAGGTQSPADSPARPT
jgi:sulfane dehydrogenase subunit SoxC